MTNAKDVIDKINKLLALSQSPNQAEAAAAAAKASELLTRYNLEVSDLGGALNEGIQERCVVNSKRAPGWKAILLNAIASANYCKALKNGGKLVLFGSPTNILVVTQMFEYLCQATDRVAKVETSGTADRNAFRLACADTLADRIVEAHREKMNEGVAGNSQQSCISAMVCVSLQQKAEAQLSEYFHNQGIRFGSGTHYRCRGGDAFEKGREAGQSISLAPQVSGNSQRALAGR